MAGECAACDYANPKVQHWVPVLAILCNEDRFEFLVYESSSKCVYSSGIVAGLVDRTDLPHLFLLSIKSTKKSSDYFIMDNVNSLGQWVDRIQKNG